MQSSQPMFLLGPTLKEVHHQQRLTKGKCSLLHRAHLKSRQALLSQDTVHQSHMSGSRATIEH